MNQSSRPLPSRALLARMTNSHKVEPVQSADRLAVAAVSKRRGGLSFSQRQEVDKNRKIVRGYGASHVGRAEQMREVRRVGMEISKPKQGQSSNVAQLDGGSGARVEQTSNRPSAGFREPSNSKYNPYR